MIRKILTTYAARLDEYLARSHRQPEGVAEVGLIGSAGEQCPNKLVVSLVNLEREASGDGGYMQRAATGYAGRRQPLLLNMHIMMAAVYEDKRYAEALSVLSDALTFIQSLPRFEVGNCLGSRSAMKVILWNWSPCPLRICTTSGRPWEGSITLRSSARFAD